ncbi:hypothetical protein G6F57_021547 [Rhizopus arrhizus]|nr:hypothetical protein G6F57_021547 [Rhizopus arrhizus]
MHHVAEEGVASHWLYKGADLTLNDLQKRTHQWLQSLLDIQSQTGDSGEFLEHVKVDLFPDAVYVFTPRGKIISLPRGATPVDFAYAIHTDIGNQAVAAKWRHGGNRDLAGIAPQCAMAQLRAHGPRPL